MSTRAAIYDLTIFDADGDPLFGAQSGGSITESDFQTPDPDKSHDRPWLKVPSNFSAPRINFAKGSSEIGALTVGVLDKRGTATDQSTGQLTAQIKQTVGQRAVLRRWDETNTQWLVLMDGVVHSFTMDRDTVVVYNFHLRDGNEFAREAELFKSNYVIWGENGKRGPLIDYGKMPVSQIHPTNLWLLRAVGPYDSQSVGGISHFKRYNDSDPDDGIFYGYTPVPAEIADHPGPRIGYPTQREDGLFYFEGIRIQWRIKDSGDAFTELTDMPVAANINAVQTGGSVSPGGYSVGDVSGDLSSEEYGLYFGSTTSDDIPTTGQEIEFRVIAVNVADGHPFYWDGGTLGDLLKEIVAGDHTDDVPPEKYDSSALDDFASNSPKARFIIHEPVTDRRKWVQENIYMPALRAPAFNTSQEIFPAKWALPTNTETIPTLDTDTIQPVGEYDDGIELAIRRVEFTYIRESIEDPATIIKTESPSWWKFWAGDEEREVPDPDDLKAPADRLVETEITASQEDTTAVTGARVLKYKPVTIRSIAGVDGAPFSGDVQDELGNRIARKAAEAVLPRFKDGAARYVVDVAATDENLGYALGDWLRVDVSWLPEYSSAKRGMRRYFQIYGISDVDPSLRKLYLVDGGVPDPEEPDDTPVKDCGTVVGGTTLAGPDNKSVIQWTDDGSIQNTCGEAITLERILLVGGGGAGAKTLSDTEHGIGGGSGQALELTEVNLSGGGTGPITIAAGETIPITVGGGGLAAGASGENTIFWLDPDTGQALDPDNDTPDPQLVAKGGNDSQQGRVGGGAFSAGSGCQIVSGTCNVNGGAGGASNEDGGGDATCNSDAESGTCESRGGLGAGKTFFSAFGVAVGGGGDGDGTGNDPESGAFPGGGGGAGGVPGEGKGGYFAIRHNGKTPLAKPTTDTTSSTSTTDTNQLEICVTEDDFPTVRPDGYRLKVEYAVGTDEPASDSGDWQVAGYLEEPGCVKTDPVPTGATVWHRLTAEGDDYLPTDTGDTSSDSTPATPALLEFSLHRDGSTMTVRWTGNVTTDEVEIRAKVHAKGDTLPDPLPTIAQVDAALGEYELSGLTLAPSQVITVDAVAIASTATASQDSSGLVERDQFDRANEQLGGNDDWEESTGGTFDIVSQVVEARKGATGGENAFQNLGDQGSAILQVSQEIKSGNLGGQLVANAVGASDLGTSYLFFPVGGSYRVVKIGTGAIGSDEGTAPGVDEPSILRMVVDRSGDDAVIRGYDAQGIDNLQDLDDDLTLQITRTDTGTEPTDPYYGIRSGDGSTAPNTDFDEFFVCGRGITVTGLPTGWQAKIDSRTAVEESSGSVSFDVDAWALPATTISILDAEDDVRDTLTPAGGIWGGDTYSVALADDTEVTYRASQERIKDTLATQDQVDGTLDDLVFNEDLGLVLDNSMVPIKGGS